MSHTLPLAGRRALVTGGASGIGAAIARCLAKDGAQVVIADLNLAGAQQVAHQIIQWIDQQGVLQNGDSTGRGSGQNDSAVALHLDVTDVEAVGAAMLAHGPFQIVVNSAGMDQHAFLTDTTVADWRRLLAVNLESVFATTQAALPAMQRARYGRIINIASEAGRLGSRGGSVYAAAKGGVIAFTRSIARENGHFGITANVVAPGPIDTPMLRSAAAQGGQKLVKAMTDATLVGRLGTPEEVAATVAFLASDAAGFITGEVLGVSGGMGCGA